MGVPPSIAKRSAIFSPPEIFVDRLEDHLETCEYDDTLADAWVFVNRRFDDPELRDSRHTRAAFILMVY
jgi:hypothetical protein